jgi:hypothetical protein
MAVPSDCAYALMAGFGPMNVMSSASAKRASTASGPALKLLVSIVTLSPRFSSNSPPRSPTMAGAWVMFGK